MSAGQLLDAVRAGRADLVQALLSAQPGLARARDERGMSALMIAQYRGRSDLVRLITLAMGGLDIFDAAMLGDVPRLTELLAADPALARAQSREGWTALHLACYFGQTPAAQLLLDQGAELEAPSGPPMQLRALHAATAARKAELVRLLLSRGAQASAPQAGGLTALHLAAQAGDAETARALAAGGALVDARDAQGRTPMDLCKPEHFGPIQDALKGAGQVDP